MNKVTKILFSLLAVFFVSTFIGTTPINVKAEDPEISVQLSSRTFTVDQAVQLDVTVHGSRKAKISFPEVEGLVITNRGQQSFMQSINGKTSISFATVYIIQSLTPGKYTIPPITALVKKKSLSTEPIEIEVIPSSAQLSANKGSHSRTLSTKDSDQNGRGGELAFIEFTPEKKTGYVGEIVPVQIKAYFRTRLESPQLPTLTGDGVVMSPLTTEPRQQREVVDGFEYTVGIWDTSLSGVKEGEYSLSVNQNVSLLIQRSRQNSSRLRNNDPFGQSIFDDFFGGGYQRKNVNLQSKPQNFHVLSLPSDDQPKDFSGAIGTFTLTATAQPQGVEIGEPITLKLIVEGKGSFDRVQCPTFPDEDNFKTYQPSSEFNEDTNTKVFERAVIPKNGSITEIPPHSFTFFDPQQRKYVTIHSQPLPILVTGGENQPAVRPVQTTSMTVAVPQQANKKSQVNKPLLNNLAPQKLVTGTLIKEIKPVFKQGWFITIVILCALVLVSLLVIFIRKRQATNNPELLRRKEASERLKLGIQELEQIKTSGDSAKMLSCCRSIIQQQLGYIWGMEPSAITFVDVQHKLESRSPLIDLFQNAEQGAYGEHSLSPEKFDEYIKTIETELEKLG